jgi:hypothetical protein
MSCFDRWWICPLLIHFLSPLGYTRTLLPILTYICIILKKKNRTSSPIWEGGGVDLDPRSIPGVLPLGSPVCAHLPVYAPVAIIQGRPLGRACACWGMVVTCSRYKFITVSLPRRLRNGRFASETATWIPFRLNFEKALDIMGFQGGGDGRGYKKYMNYPRGLPRIIVTNMQCPSPPGTAHAPVYAAVA